MGGKKFKEFREWMGVDEIEGKMLAGASASHNSYVGVKYSDEGYDEQVYIEIVKSGSFKESGTNVKTCIVVINKR